MILPFAYSYCLMKVKPKPAVITLKLAKFGVIEMCLVAVTGKSIFGNTRQLLREPDAPAAGKIPEALPVTFPLIPEGKIQFIFIA